METRNFIIDSRTTKVLTFALCEPSTHTFACKSYPVFSVATTDGTNAYATDTSLRRLWPVSSYLTADSPTVSYDAASGTGTITFDYGLMFDDNGPEWYSTAKPRRYRYYLHTAMFHSAASAYSSSITADSSVIFGGAINMVQVRGSVQSYPPVCSIEVE